MGMEILDEEEEGDEDEGQWELENEAGRDEDGPAGWDRSIHADYDVMQNEFCDDWRRQKGTACPHPTPVNDAHMYLLHGHLACGKRSARNATRSVRKAVALDPGLLMGHNLLAKIYIGQGRFRKAVSHLKKALDIDPTMWEALIQLQFVLHRTGELASALGRDVNEKICTRIGELFRRQGVAGDPASVGLCSFFDTVTWHRPLEQDPSIATRMREHKYVALADILAPPIVAVLQQYYRTIIDTRYKVRFAEKTRRWEFEEAPLANLVNLMLTDLVSRITGQAVVPTYAFPVYYVSGGHIWPHLDVAENEISLTMQLELTPPGAAGPVLAWWPCECFRRLSESFDASHA